MIQMNVFFKYITPCTCVWISRRVGIVPWCTCVARRDLAHMHAHPGVATPVPCALPRATEPGRPTACTIPPRKRRNPQVNPLAVHSGPPIVNHRTVIGGIHDPVRGQSSVAGDAIPGRVVCWEMIAAQVLIALKHATRRRETQWRAMLQFGVEVFFRTKGKTSL